MNNLKGIKLNDKGKVYLFDNIGIINALRSPFGKFKGAYSNISATDIAVYTLKGLLKNSNLSPELIDQVIFANTIPSSNDAIFLARHIALKSGCSEKTLASMAQRICASGLETVILAAIDLSLNCSDLIIAGGTENMTRAPFAGFDMRNGVPLGKAPLADLLWEGLKDSYCNLTMGETAENLASQYNITRNDADQYAYISHVRAIEANKSGLFKHEITETPLLSNDETIRDTINIEKLKTLKPVFKENGIMTAGNSSLIADGASALILSKTTNNIDFKAKIIAASIAGEKPEIMGITPVNAIKNLLFVTGLNTDNIDLWEINEAFSGQYLAVEKALELNRDKINVNGGSIAIGHPLAATGGRLITTLIYELKRRNKKYGIASACVGGGQATAILVEVG